MSIRYTKNMTQNSKSLRQDTYKYIKTYMYKSFSDIVGSGNIIRAVFFDSIGTDTTLTDLSSNKKNITLSLQSNLLDNTINKNCRVLNFNGSGDYFYFDDSDDLSFGNGTTDSAFSVITCYKYNATGLQRLLAKWRQSSNNCEWFFYSYENKMRFELYDDNASTYIGRIDNAANDSTSGTFRTRIATYDGSSNSSGVKVYLDATQIDNGNDAGGSYTAMANKTGIVGNVYHNSSDVMQVGEYNFQSAFVAIVSIELSAQQVILIDRLLRANTGSL